MRLQLTVRVVAATLAGLWVSAETIPARADGEVRVRGVYYKERATRVVQPMSDVRLDIGEDTEVRAHFLVDSITSASSAAGSTMTDDGEFLGFTESRVEGGGSLSRRVDTFQVTGFIRYSSEPDYTSLFGGVRTTSELARRNTTLGLALALGRDDVSNEGAQLGPDTMGTIPEVRGRMRTLLGSIAVTQVLSPQFVGGVTYDLSYQEGFLENAYRMVPVRGVEVSEAVPDTRLRHALFASVRGFVPATRTTLYAGYRLYVDDWDLWGHTPEVRAIQEIVADVAVHARYRFHSQSAAFFYEPIYDAPQPFVTSDIKLSPFSSHTFGAKLEAPLAAFGASGRFAAFRAELGVDYVVQKNRFGNALVMQVGLAVPFAY